MTLQKNAIAQSYTSDSGSSTQLQLYGLTGREKQILSLLVEGMTMKSIAYELGLSYYTITTHCKNIYMKLDVRSGKSAIVKALKENLI